MNDEVQKLANQRIKDARKQLKQETEQQGEEFAAAFATAALGIVKGIDPQQSNPIQAKLVEVLSKHGVRNPERFVHSALEAAIEPFLQATMASARELLDKTPEAREEVARYVAKARFSESATETNEVTARLTKGGTATVHPVMTQANPTGGKADEPSEVFKKAFRLLG